MPAPPPPARPPLSAPRDSPLPRLSACARVSALRAPHTPRLSLRTQQPGTARHAVWGGTIMSRPIPSRPPARAHANKPTPGREHASKQARRGKGVAGPHCPTTPSKRANTQKTQTPKRTRPARKHETQPPASKHAHNKPQQGTPPSEHKERPRQSAWASKMCERRRTRVPSRGDRHEAKQAKPPQGRARRTSAHKASAQTTWFAPKRCRPAPARRGVRRERKAAHNSPRQSAWVVVFVGVFADVCRLFGLVGFGGLGVFWGCLACFLVF